MSSGNSSRRHFLVRSASGLSSAWLLSKWPAILKAQEQARRAAKSSPGTFQFFSPAQALEIDAISGQIIPSDDLPGAREAHVIHFIDQALVTFERNKQPIYRAGLRDLQVSTKRNFP